MPLLVLLILGELYYFYPACFETSSAFASSSSRGTHWHAFLKLPNLPVDHALDFPPPPYPKVLLFFRMISQNPSPHPTLVSHQSATNANKTVSLFFSNSFFLIPVFHFPWSEKGREARLTKAASHTA